MNDDGVVVVVNSGEPLLTMKVIVTLDSGTDGEGLLMQRCEAAHLVAVALF